MDTQRPTIAVIGFSSQSSPLEPAWPSTHRAVLPIVGKALIVHSIEILIRLGIKHIRVAGSIQQYAVEKRLGDGKEWDVTIRYSDLHHTDLLTQTLLEKKHCLFILGDQMHSINIGHPWLATSGNQVATINPGEHTALWTLTKGEITQLSLLGLSSLKYKSFPISSCFDFHQANRLAVSNALTGISLPGKAIRDNCVTDWDTSISRSAHLGAGTFIGKHCKIGNRVTLESNCILGAGVVLSGDTHLKNVTVLPNTYVGRNIRLQNAVVSPIGIFDLENNFWPIHEQSVLTRSRANKENITGLPSHQLSVVEKSMASNSPAMPSNHLLTAKNDGSSNHTRAMLSRELVNPNYSTPIFRRTK